MTGSKPATVILPEKIHPIDGFFVARAADTSFADFSEMPARREISSAPASEALRT